MGQSLPAHRRALIVEDEPLFAMGLAADMQALGFDTCDLAANGQDAFLQAMEDEPDIVLMDINLEGGREGIEAARWLREVCDIPIVFVTAHTDHDTVQRIHQQVPDAPVIAKPLYREGLAKAVARVRASSWPTESGGLNTEPAAADANGPSSNDQESSQPTACLRPETRYRRW
jgi:DNA-binding NarL/FixJ family response regulator